MKVLKATHEQKAAIESQTTGSHLIRFIEDSEGNYVIGKNVMNNKKFNQILELKELIEIDFKPIFEHE